LSSVYRVDTATFPKGSFIAAIVQFAVMNSAKRDDPLIAGLETPCAGLDELEVMGLRRQATADEAGLSGDETEVIFVPNSLGGGYRENALVNTGG
jgi:hypothetical protein